MNRYKLMLMSLAFSLAVFVFTGQETQLSGADETIFSGPQVGEALVSFKALGVFDELANQNVDPVADANGGPIMLIFVHQVTRPSVGLVRTIVNFANSRKPNRLPVGLVFLSNDRTETEAWMHRARRALPAEVPPLISPDGIEGPGAYGLNRKMTLTILVGKEGKVTDNFALIQPSVQADAPKIGYAIVKALGGNKQPSLADMGVDPQGRPMQARIDGIYRRMMSPVIQKDATPDEVHQAAKAVEELAGKNARFKARVHNAANLIVSSGKLADYGTPTAQEYIKKWGMGDL